MNNKKLNIAAVIPARSGSKGVPDKNVKLIAGKPVISFSISAAKESKLINRVIVSTDSVNYVKIANKYGAEAPFLRPPNLSTDSSTDYDFVQHLLDWLSKTEDYTPDYLVHLRPTTPIRSPLVIDNAINKLINNPKATSLRSIHEMSETAYKQVELENGYLKTIFTGSFDLDSANKNRQKYPVTYTPNGYVDVLKTSFILENRMLHGDRVIGFITDTAIEIDTLDDFNFLEWKLSDNNL